jgi:aryl-alcohol dehydrogenase-like predicted oxidoreductase
VRDASPARIREGVESSLRALATDQMEDFSATLAVKTLQPPYHLFRRAIEVEVLP